MGACHEKYLSGLLLHSVLAICLDDSLAEPLHNEKAPSVPRIEIPFRCRTWTGLSLCFLYGQHRNRRWSLLGLNGDITRGFSFMPATQNTFISRPPPPSSPCSACFQFSLTCWRRQQLCGFLPGRDWIKPGGDKTNKQRSGDNLAVSRWAGRNLICLKVKAL